MAVPGLSSSKIMAQLVSPILSTWFILKFICERLNVNVVDIRGSSRKREVVEVRHIYCHICKRITKYSLDVIGREINRDHATVIHGNKTIQNLSTYDPQIKKKVHEILIDLMSQANE